MSIVHINNIIPIIITLIIITPIVITPLIILAYYDDYIIYVIYNIRDIYATFLTPAQGNFRITENPGVLSDPLTFLKKYGTYGHLPGAKRNDFSRRCPWC